MQKSLSHAGSVPVNIQTWFPTRHEVCRTIGIPASTISGTWYLHFGGMNCLNEAVKSLWSPRRPWRLLVSVFEFEARVVRVAIPCVAKPTCSTPCPLTHTRLAPAAHAQEWRREMVLSVVHPSIGPIGLMLAPAVFAHRFSHFDTPYTARPVAPAGW